MLTTDQMREESVEAQAAPLSGRAKLAYRTILVSGVALAATGILTFLLGKAPMTGWVLMAHVAAAPLFAIGLAWMALTWAAPCRFGDGGSGQSGPAKALLWLMLLCGLIVMLSAVVPMTPLFGTSGQHLLYLTHRYSAMVFTGALGLHLLTRICAR